MSYNAKPEPTKRRNERGMQVIRPHPLMFSVNDRRDMSHLSPNCEPLIMYNTAEIRKQGGKGSKAIVRNIAPTLTTPHHLAPIGRLCDNVVVMVHENHNILAGGMFRAECFKRPTIEDL
jgi:hypothetical protein